MITIEDGVVEVGVCLLVSFSSMLITEAGVGVSGKEWEWWKECQLSLRPLVDEHVRIQGPERAIEAKILKIVHRGDGSMADVYLDVGQFMFEYEHPVDPDYVFAEENGELVALLEHYGFKRTVDEVPS